MMNSRMRKTIAFMLCAAMIFGGTSSVLTTRAEGDLGTGAGTVEMSETETSAQGDETASGGGTEGAGASYEEPGAEPAGADAASGRSNPETGEVSEPGQESTDGASVDGGQDNNGSAAEDGQGNNGGTVDGSQESNGGAGSGAADGSQDGGEGTNGSQENNGGEAAGGDAMDGNGSSGEGTNGGQGNNDGEAAGSGADGSQNGGEGNDSSDGVDGSQDSDEGAGENQEDSDGEDSEEEGLDPDQDEDKEFFDEDLIDTTADVEDVSDWDALYADMEWADAWGENLVMAARMQIGYRESQRNYRIAADGSHKGYTRYGAFAGNVYADWDAAFVNFCIYYAGLSESGLFPEVIDASRWFESFIEAGEENGEYLTAPDGYEPEAGDIVFFEKEEESGKAPGSESDKKSAEEGDAESEKPEEEKTEGSGLVKTKIEKADTDKRMGIVSSYDREQQTITVIEGDSDDEVKENVYDLDDGSIICYLMVAELEESVKIHTLTAEGDDYTITVSYTKEAGIPEGTVLDVREIEADSEEYQMYYEQSLEALGVEALSFARYFDITFLADGEKIEPLAPVDVVIVYDDPVETEVEGEDNVVHFAEDGIEVLEVEVDEEGRSFNFSQDSFSVLGTTRTGMLVRAAVNETGRKYYRVQADSLDSLDGKSFLLTNINQNGKVNCAMKGEQLSHSMKDGRSRLVAYDFGSTQDVLDSNSGYVWTFEKVPDAASDIFYIKNAAGYLSIDGFNGTNRANVALKSKTDDSCKLKVKRNSDGTIAIYKTIAHNKKNYDCYINNASGGAPSGVPAHFTAWYAENGSPTGANNKLTLYSAAGYVVLNPYNITEDGCNSTYRFRVDGEEDALNKIAIDMGANAGEAVITLPSEETRKTGFTINNETHYIEDSTDSNAYDWRLKGWYNIATGEYISAADNWTTRIDLSRNNVFYADWVASGYDNGVNKDALGGQRATVDAKDSRFMSTQLFDYNELANIALNQANPNIGATVVQRDAFAEAWTAEKKLTGTGLSNTVQSVGFAFLDGAYNYTVEHDKATNLQSYIGIKGSLGYPIGSDRSRVPDDAAIGNILGTLFNQGSPMGVQYVGEAAGLYSLDADGYYEYDSDVSAASYYKSGGEFTVYKAPQRINRHSAESYKTENPQSSFLPFNGEAAEFTHLDGQVNYWFGMKTEINFWLNDQSGGSDRPNYNNDKPMIFEFTGDDDLWVFDEYNGQERLLLNLSGVHGKLTGTINFSDGKVTEEYIAKENGKEVVKPGKGKTFTFEPGQHKLTIYYMERGGGLSNCKIRFNLVPKWEFEGTPVQAVSAKKEWADADTDGRPEEIEVKLYKRALDGGNDILIDSQKLNAGNGWTYTWRYLDKDSTYRVEEEELDSYRTDISDPPDETGKPCSYWRESTGLEREDGGEVRIAIGNGLPGESGRVLKAEDSGAVSIAQIAASETGNVLMNDGEGEWGIPESCQWIVHIVQTSDGHMQFQLESASKRGCYLSIKDGQKGPQLVSGAENGSVLYFFGNGNLTGTSTNRLVLSGDKASFQIVERADTGDIVTEGGASHRRVHIYKYEEKLADTKRTEYTITNTRITAEIQIQKVSQSSSEELLPGAEFKLYDSDYYDEETDTVNSNATPREGQDNLVSGPDGKVTSFTLPVGVYYLVEDKAPVGYELLTNPVKITVSKDGTGANARANVEVDFKVLNWEDDLHLKYDDTLKKFTVEVPNAILYILPSTGGKGTYWYLVSGTLLMLAAVLASYRRKRKSEREVETELTE